MSHRLLADKITICMVFNPKKNRGARRDLDKIHLNPVAGARLVAIYIEKRTVT
jgi:hypothetical protein